MNKTELLVAASTAIEAVAEQVDLVCGTREPVLLKKILAILIAGTAASYFMDEVSRILRNENLDDVMIKLFEVAAAGDLLVGLTAYYNLLETDNKKDTVYNLLEALEIMGSKIIKEMDKKQQGLEYLKKEVEG